MLCPRFSGRKAIKKCKKHRFGIESELKSEVKPFEKKEKKCWRPILEDTSMKKEEEVKRRISTFCVSFNIRF